MRKFFSGWIVAAVILVIVIAAGAFIIHDRRDSSGPLEVIFQPAPAYSGSIYIGGGVAVPGWYPVSDSDTIADLLQAAGGYTGENPILLHLTTVSADTEPQKININTAPTWLLRALPGIGENRAQAIIDYRTEHGHFRDVDELLKVEGIGPGILETLREFVAVSE